MSEHDSIHAKKAEVIFNRVMQETETSKEEEKNKKEKHKFRTEAKLRIQVGRFLVWATEHDIAYDFNTNKLRAGGRTVVERVQEVFTPRVAGWRVASRPYEYTAYGSTFMYTRHLAVETHGLIGEAIEDGGFYTSNFSNGVMTKDIVKYKSEQIHLRIAELCLEHGIDWDMPE